MPPVVEQEDVLPIRHAERLHVTKRGVRTDHERAIEALGAVRGIVSMPPERTNLRDTEALFIWPC